MKYNCTICWSQTYDCWEPVQLGPLAEVLIETKLEDSDLSEAKSVIDLVKNL